VYPQLTDAAWLRQRYLSEKASTADIAAELGCGEHSVRRALTTAGIRLQGRSRSRRYPQLADTSWLRNRHVDQGLTASDIAREVGCNETTVRNALRAAGIQLIYRRGPYP
jgi:DNA-binding CsgD family transcriptional regulator